MELTNEEYSRVMSLKKCFDKNIILPQENESKDFGLHSRETGEEFLLSAERKNIVKFSIYRSKFNHCYSKIPIVRLEIGGRPHINPDGTFIGRDHIHIFKEGYDLSWAYELSEENYIKHFHNYNDYNLLFEDICVYCNIVIPNNLQNVM